LPRLRGPGSCTAPRRGDRAVGGWTVQRHHRLRGALPITFYTNRVDPQSQSDGAIGSHSVACAQMGRFHNDGNIYYSAFHVLRFMMRLVLCSVVCKRSRSPSHRTLGGTRRVLLCPRERRTEQIRSTPQARSELCFEPETCLLSAHGSATWLNSCESSGSLLTPPWD